MDIDLYPSQIHISHQRGSRRVRTQNRWPYCREQRGAGLWSLKKYFFFKGSTFGRTSFKLQLAFIPAVSKIFLFCDLEHFPSIPAFKFSFARSCPCPASTVPPLSWSCAFSRTYNNSKDFTYDIMGILLWQGEPPMLDVRKSLGFGTNQGEGLSQSQILVKKNARELPINVIKYTLR